MKQDPDFFDGKEPSLIYIAKKLKEALALEGVLTEAGVDYGVEADSYRGGFVFQSEREPSHTRRRTHANGCSSASRSAV
jgi:hypothetical protein